MEVTKEITTRQLATLLETVSRIHRQVDLIYAGNTVVGKNGKNRLEIVDECAQKIHNILITI